MRIIPLLILCTQFFTIFLFSQEDTIDQIQLNNGMKVWLKHTCYDKDQVVIGLIAKGGYASLPPDERFSAEICPLVAWESGLENMSSDQISVSFYNHCVELLTKLQPFHRTIEGSCEQSELPFLLNYIEKIFTKSQFTPEGWNYGLKVVQSRLQKQSQDSEFHYDTLLTKINTCDFDVLRPMSAENVESLHFDIAKKSFSTFFSNPKDFACIIVGDFNKHHIREQLESSLGKIPIQTQPLLPSIEFSAPFPEGITEKQIRFPSRNDCLTRICIPISIPLTQDNISHLSLVCRIIETKFRKAIELRNHPAYALDVSYEFPLYPLLNNPWISIKYRSKYNQIHEVKSLLLSLIEKLQREGLTAEEYNEIYQKEDSNDEFWLHDNDYWIQLLSNYFLWDWDPNTSNKQHKSLPSKDQIELHIKNGVNIKNFSAITAHP